jgi:hypothetical protein
MRRATIYQYYQFGYNYSLWKRSGLEGYSYENALTSLRELWEFFDQQDLQVTIQVGESLWEIAKELEVGDQSQKVAAALATRIKTAIKALDATLDAELQLRDIWVMTKKRYPLDTLLDYPGRLLATGVYDSLDDHTQRDFQLACRNIALKNATSAAFHLMRATEQQVKMLYFAFKKTNRMLNPMWGPMVQELRKKNKPRPSTALLDHLDAMRKNYRNPTQHPDVFYNIEEAQDLLNSVTGAINMIAKEMPKPKAAAKKVAKSVAAGPATASVGAANP